LFSFGYSADYIKLRWMLVKNFLNLSRNTLDKTPALPIIPPDMVTFFPFRGFLFEPAGLTVSFVLERAVIGSLFLYLHEEKCSNFLD
jgi:hypothetical protein